jgi:sugar lactone lactonase YvrE
MIFDILLSVATVLAKLTSVARTRRRTRWPVGNTPCTCKAVPLRVCTVDSSNTNLYVVDKTNHTIRKIVIATGVVTTLAGAGTDGYADGIGAAALFAGPGGLAIDSSGNLYTAEKNNHTIRKITPAGVVTTLAGTVGTEGNADGTGAAASFATPHGLAVDSSGNVYVADKDNLLIRKITPTGW